MQWRASLYSGVQLLYSVAYSYFIQWHTASLYSGVQLLYTVAYSFFIQWRKASLFSEVQLLYSVAYTGGGEAKDIRYNKFLATSKIIYRDSQKEKSLEERAEGRYIQTLLVGVERRKSL